MTREVMEQALNALLDLQSLDSQDVWLDRWSEAITSLREALEQQPAQEQQQAEPVAWTTMPEAADWCFVSGGKDPTGKLEGKWFPLYTTPPQREWVGLTDEEIEAIGDRVANEQLVGPVSNFRVRLAQAIEQTLKERNK